MSKRVSTIGEFALIELITARLPAQDDVLVGPGDDAAVVAAPDGRFVVTTDLLVERRHFRRDWSSAYDIGQKAAAQNLSDVAAMGARPTTLLLGLALPPETAVDWVLELVDGLRDECDRAKASIVGGDISRADAVVLAITAHGSLDGRPPVLRRGARPGDVVVLGGRVGWAAAGLALLTGDRREPAELVTAHRRPRPPYPLGAELAAAGATAMCDVSDGLLQDLGHIADASRVGIELDSTAFEVPGIMRQAADLLGVDPLGWMLTGGDDNALVACLPAPAAVPAGCVVIGTVVREPGVRVDGAVWSGPGGHDHFRR
ncbi:thiamine-phosphate kinase [Dactylosporangium aurantiacum]|uniref:Thiamine-monophosphate kinase n=1 Tax=Dactylosporangium aurantiacum TaxID=35754 RepID=A0A9Q9INZ5_9ACTN|nr:thiamine-phosphate kinase [Dactylosporangium aurantiacum]MDG6107832.1 thiamine-phosphate kinase [Dactylosporangium aurantiacum]UWZ57395.1 thiamine-phosphate kinase [Dactylosporangium aurantiacum]